MRASDHDPGAKSRRRERAGRLRPTRVLPVVPETRAEEREPRGYRPKVEPLVPFWVRTRMRTPHDTLCHSVFRHHACASAWVVSVLPGRLSQWIDWSAFQPANGHVSGLRLRSHHADLVFTARLLGGEHRVLFVIEHKSSPDEALHWQVLRYSVHLAHSTRRRHGALPFLLPLVLTHGGSRSPAPLGPTHPRNSSLTSHRTSRHSDCTSTTCRPAARPHCWRAICRACSSRWGLSHRPR